MGVTVITSPDTIVERHGQRRNSDGNEFSVASRTQVLATVRGEKTRRSGQHHYCVITSAAIHSALVKCSTPSQMMCVFLS